MSDDARQAPSTETAAGPAPLDPTSQRARGAVHWLVRIA